MVLKNFCTDLFFYNAGKAEFFKDDLNLQGGEEASLFFTNGRQVGLEPYTDGVEGDTVNTGELGKAIGFDKKRSH